MSYHNRNPAKHEYEVQADGTAHVFVGNTEQTAMRNAVDLMANGVWADRNVACVRLYHTYPSPGAVRRFVGWIHREDGRLRRAGR